MNARVAVTVSVAFCALLSGCLAAPVGWRTDGTGRYPHAGPPIRWSATENVVWKTPLPKRSNASPVVVGDRIFVLKKFPDDPNAKQKMAGLKEQIKQLEAQLKEIAQIAIVETHPVNGYMYVRGTDNLYCIGR